MPSEILPVFSARAMYVAFQIIPAQSPLGKNKIRIDFAVDSINKNGQKKNHIPMELASQVGAYLSVKIDPSRYDAIKHLLKENLELNLTVCPLAWKTESGSGMFYDLVGIEKFSAILETA